MGSHDRSYMRRASAPALPPVTKALLIMNVAVFLIDFLMDRGLTEFGAFTVRSAFREFKIWELLTLQFLHESPWHLIFNAIGIYFFGPSVERWWGHSGRFLAYYLICGAAGALFFTLLLPLNLLPKATIWSPLIGASAGLFGLYFAVYKIAPLTRVQLLIPPVNLSMRQLAIIFAVISVGTILGGLAFPSVFRNEGGEAGHLGGALMGVLLMKYPWLLRKGSRPGSKVIRTRAFRQRGKPKVRPRSAIDLGGDSEVDRILDKVNAEGFGSLSEEERRILEQASRKDS